MRKPPRQQFKEGHSVKKAKLLPLIFLLTFLGLSTLILLSGKAAAMNAKVQASSLDSVQVDKVDHTVQILQDGSIAINDTVQLSAKQDTTLTVYPLGFPYKYKYNLAYVYAFNTSSPSQTFNVSLDTGLDNSVGYYGVTVIFPQSGVRLYVDGPPFRFTVVFVFLNEISSSTWTHLSETVPPTNVTEPILTMDYPTFPSLLQNVSIANVTVITPPNTAYETSSGKLAFKKNVGASQVANLTRKSLAALTNAAGWLNFSVSTGSVYQLFSIDDLKRQMNIDGQGNIFVTETYTVTSYTTQAVSSMGLSLPVDSNNVAAYGAQGNSMAITLLNKSTATYSLSFGFALQPGNSTQFTLNYHLPSSVYIIRTGSSEFYLDLPITKGLEGIVGKLTLKISLPEGASIEAYPSIKDYGLQKGVLQQEILFTAYNVSSYNNLNLRTTYVYSIFWSSLLPTLWMSAFMSVAVVIALIWERPKPSLPSTTPRVAAKPQTLQSIVSSYEERIRISRELESIERQVQKGRMPRRRYKMRRRMLESQLNRLDRELADLKERVKSVGPKYAEILKELDIAEAELEGVDAESKRVEARYRSGTLSLDTYKHQQDQLNKRREKAKTIIDGALLRLGEETA
jgi:hypothetical protein